MYFTPSGFQTAAVLDAPRFEVEDDQGRSIRYGEWLQRGDGVWVLRIPTGS